MINARMKIGFVISMYEEINNVLANIKNIRKEAGIIIVIQSDPQDPKKLLNKSLVDYYELLPDLAQSPDEYKNLRKQGGPKANATRANCRNCSHGFKIAKNLDIDWWIYILGDVSITNLSGIKKIINNMIKKNKILGVTRAIGQTLYDNNGELTSYQNPSTTTILPTFFIVKATSINQGLFNDIKITNQYTTEQCFGDEVKNFCDKNSINFYESCYFISDEAYPDYIKGLKYNYPQPKTPRFLRRLKKYLRS